MAFGKRMSTTDDQRETVSAASEDMLRIDAAINGIVETRRQLAKLAEKAGLSLAGVRL
jgi:hypothetical protein